MANVRKEERMGRIVVCLTLVGLLGVYALFNSGCSPIDVAANVADFALSTGMTAVDARVNMDRVGNTTQPMDVVWDASLMAVKKLKIIVDDKNFGENEATIAGHYGRLDYIRIYLFKQSPVSTKIAIQARTALLPMTKNGYDYSFAKTIMDSISECIPEAATKVRDEDKTYEFVDKGKPAPEKGEPIDLASYVPEKEGSRYEYISRWKTRNKSGTVNSKYNFLEHRLLNGIKTEPIHVSYRHTPSGKSGSYFMFYVLDDSGYYEYAKQKSDMPEPEILDKPFYDIKSPCYVGRVWEGEFDTYLLIRKIKIPAIYTIDRADDIVTVPAGTFNRCMRIRWYSHVKNSKGYIIKANGYYWYALGVGYIKSIEKVECTDPTTGGGGTITTELVSYSIPDESEKKRK